MRWKATAHNFPLGITLSPTTSGAHCDLRLSGPFALLQLAPEARGERVCSDLLPVAGFVNEAGGDGVRA